MMVEVFQIAGIRHLLKDQLYRRVRYVQPSWPRCFRCSIVMPSGPVALEFRAFLIAKVTSIRVKTGGFSRGLALTFRLMVRVILDDLCVVTVVKALLNESAILFGHVSMRSLKAIPQFGLFVVLPSSDFIMFHKRFGSFL